MQRHNGRAFHHHRGASLNILPKRGGVAAQATPPWWFGKCQDGRSRAAEFPNGNAEASRLVGKVVLDSRAREMHDADWHQFEHGVVALEWRCLGLCGPVRPERGPWAF